MHKRQVPPSLFREGIIFPDFSFWVKKDLSVTRPLRIRGKSGLHGYSLNFQYSRCATTWKMRIKTASAAISAATENCVTPVQAYSIMSFP